MGYIRHSFRLSDRQQALLGKVASSTAIEEPVAPLVAHHEEEERYEVEDWDVTLLVGRLPFQMHVRDLSCRELSGLTDAPVAQGQLLHVELVNIGRRQAQVRWVNSRFAGLYFLTPLPARFVRKVGNLASSIDKRPPLPLRSRA